MHFKLRLIPTAVATMLVAACGGGGGGATNVGAAATNGAAVDGYLNFAKVVCDANENGVYDPGEQVTYTSNNGDGKFTFRPGCTHSILGGADGTGTNADTGLPFVGLLRAPAGATVVTPLTTLVSAGMTPTEITKALNLPVGTNILTTDPAATKADGSLANPDLLKTALAVQQLLQKTTEFVNSLSNTTGSLSTAAVYTQVAAAMASTLKSGPALITGGVTPVMDQSVVKTLVTGAVTAIASAPSVDTAVKTALANAGGVATLPAVVNAALTAQAQALLSSSAANLTATALDRQSNTTIADTLVSAVAAGNLGSATSPADLEALGSTVAVEAVKPTPTPTSLKSGLLTTFDEAAPLAFSGFAGAEGSAIEAGPAGGVGKALKVLRTGGEVYAGAIVTVGPMDVSASHATITARVYSPLAGIPVVLKLEGTDSNNNTGDMQAVETVVAGWQTLSWVVPSAKYGSSYTKVVLLPHLGTRASTDPGEAFYFDNLILGAALPSYLYLPNNAIGFSSDGTSGSTVNYSMATFQSSGINVKWPMVNGAALKLNLSEKGSFKMAAGQTLTAAVQIEDTSAGSQAQMRAYTDGVTISKSGSDITLNVPNLPQALIYGVSANGQTKAVIDFANKVRGISNVLSTAANAVSTVMFGEVVNYGITGLSNDFTGMSALRGKYKVTIVVTELPLRKADGTAFDNATIQVPTSAPGGVPTGIIPVTGASLVGYINLTD